MSRMDKGLTNCSIFRTLVLFSLCVGILVAHTFICCAEYLSVWEDFRQLTEYGDVFEHAHSHDCEDDYLISKWFAADARVMFTSKIAAACLSAISYISSPVVPPPKVV